MSFCLWRSGVTGNTVLAPRSSSSYRRKVQRSVSAACPMCGHEALWIVRKVLLTEVTRLLDSVVLNADLELHELKVTR